MNLTDVLTGYGADGKALIKFKKKSKPKTSKKPAKRPNNVVNKYINQNGRCYYCKCEMVLMREGKIIPPNYATKDHIIPRKFGGKGKQLNIVIACQACNSERGHMDFEQFKVLKEQATKTP